MRYRLPDPKCRHARKGLVSAGEPTGAYASTQVCDRPACIEDANAWATAVVREPARHRPDPQPQRAQQRLDLAEPVQ